MSDYTMEDLGEYLARQEVAQLRNENEDLQDGAEHDHRIVRELEKKVEHYMKVKEEWIDKAVELRKQLDAAEAANEKLRERVQHLVEQLEEERNAR